MSQKPNIVYLHSHDTGRYVSPYGHGCRTPTMQHFAEQGVLFRRAFCANPTCSPSRAALLTGQSAHSCGMYGLANRGFALPRIDHHLVRTLNDAGYETALSGITHVTPRPEEIGYATRLNSGSRHYQAGPAAADYIREQATSGDKPFFLSVGFFETHQVFPEPDPEDDPRYATVPEPLPDAGPVRRDMAKYNTMVHDLDRGFHHVLKALRDTGLEENTLVIMTTDHGIPLPDMKCNLTDHGIGVMLMLRGPSDSPFRGGRVIDSLVSQIDLFPTICDYIGIDKPDWLEGHSLMPLARGEVDAVRDEVFAELNYHASYEPQRCVRTDRYKYIRRFEPIDHRVLPNVDACLTKDYMLEQGWGDRAPAMEQLYDLSFDPAERSNVVEDSAYADVRRELADRLDRWMRDTDDPLLRGPVPAQPGVKVNPPDQSGPDEPPEPAPLVEQNA